MLFLCQRKCFIQTKNDFRTGTFETLMLWWIDNEPLKSLENGQWDPKSHVISQCHWDIQKEKHTWLPFLTAHIKELYNHKMNVTKHVLHGLIVIKSVISFIDKFVIYLQQLYVMELLFSFNYIQSNWTPSLLNSNTANR